MIISIDTQRKYDKIQHLLLIITQPTEIQWNFYNLINNIYEKTIANIFNGERQYFSPDIKQHSTGHSGH